MISPALNLQLLEQQYGGVLKGDLSAVAVRQIITDSRKVKPGDCFIALVGEHMNGHDYIDQALVKGAKQVVTDRPLDISADVLQWIVTDTTRALGHMAQAHRAKYKGKVFALTGSAGKTTVKSLLHSVLSEVASTAATKGNFNNHIGVPYTLLDLQQEDMAVIEMGASGPNEIAYLCELAKPDVTLITNILPAHLEGFGSIDGVAKAKQEIYKALPESGVAIINLDEPYSRQWLAELNEISTLCFSRDKNNSQADVYLKSFSVDECGSLTVEVCDKSSNDELQVKTQLVGEHNLSNVLAVVASAKAMGLSLAQMQKGLELFQPVAGRMQVHNLPQGFVVDDSYNANPAAVKAGIDFICQQTVKPILALGAMGELGESSEEMHLSLIHI